jgi:GTP-binding protein EngB required for normal cell division
MTKSDKISKNEKVKSKKIVEDEFLTYKNINNINTFSSKNGDGVIDVLKIIEEVCKNN